MTRKEAREFLMKIIFQMETRNDFDESNIQIYLTQESHRGQEDYLTTNLTYLCNNKDQVDKTINKYSPKWKTNRMAKVDLAILRLAICEFNSCDDIPTSVTINECVELAKVYSSDEAAPFINGVLGGIVNE